VLINCCRRVGTTSETVVLKIIQVGIKIRNRETINFFCRIVEITSLSRSEYMGQVPFQLISNEKLDIIGALASL